MRGISKSLVWRCCFPPEWRSFVSLRMTDITMSSLPDRIAGEIVNKPTFNVGLKAVVLNSKNEMLLIQRSAENTVAGKWDIPGGRMSFGESLDEALAREVREESGLEVEAIGTVLSVCTFMRDVSASNQIVRITFAVRATEGEIMLSDEHQAYEWVGLDRVKEFDLFSVTVAEAAEKARELLAIGPELLFSGVVPEGFVK